MNAALDYEVRQTRPLSSSSRQVLIGLDVLSPTAPTGTSSVASRAIQSQVRLGQGMEGRVSAQAEDRDRGFLVPALHRPHVPT